MVSYSLLLAASVTLIVATSYGLVARNLLRRPLEDAQHRRAMRLFAMWWYVTAFNILQAGFLYLAAALGYSGLAAQLASAVLQRILLGVALVGLMYYLLYLLTARDWLLPLAAFYLAVVGILVYSLLTQRPDGVVTYAWRTNLHFASEGSVVLGLLSFLAIFAPPIIGSLAYFRLFFHIDKAGHAQRFRIAIVSWSIIAWWAIALVAGQQETMGNETFQFVNRFVGLAAALAILAAYNPPTWLRRRWGQEAFVVAPA